MGCFFSERGGGWPLVLVLVMVLGEEGEKGRRGCGSGRYAAEGYNGPNGREKRLTERRRKGC